MIPVRWAGPTASAAPRRPAFSGRDAIATTIPVRWAGPTASEGPRHPAPLARAGGDLLRQTPSARRASGLRRVPCRDWTIAARRAGRPCRSARRAHARLLSRPGNRMRSASRACRLGSAAAKTLIRRRTPTSRRGRSAPRQPVAAMPLPRRSARGARQPSRTYRWEDGGASQPRLPRHRVARAAQQPPPSRPAARVTRCPMRAWQPARCRAGATKAPSPFTRASISNASST